MDFVANPREPWPDVKRLVDLVIVAEDSDKMLIKYWLDYCIRKDLQIQ